MVSPALQLRSYSLQCIHLSTERQGARVVSGAGARRCERRRTGKIIQDAYSLRRLPSATRCPMLHAWALTILSAVSESGSGSGSGFSAGVLCSDVGPTTPASAMLRNKHLLVRARARAGALHAAPSHSPNRSTLPLFLSLLPCPPAQVSELDWSPFAKKDDAGLWSGIDIDILDSLSNMLNFTYEVRLMDERVSGESWTDLLKRDSGQADLTASYWTHSVERFDYVIMLKGHLDLAGVLMARIASESASKEASWVQSFYAWLHPFSYDLWIALLIMVICSGVVDFLIERVRVPETTLYSSMYEYTAGLLWGGFEYPLTRTSAIFQVFLGLFILIIISSCESICTAVNHMHCSPAVRRGFC